MSQSKKRSEHHVSNAPHNISRRSFATGAAAIVGSLFLEPVV